MTTASADPATPAAGGGVAVGIDVGGTKIAAGLVAADGSVIDHVRRATPEDGEEIADLCVAIALELCGNRGLGPVPVGVGAAGMVDLAGVVRFAPNIPWRDFPLRHRISAALGTPVTVDNDANVAAWGEYRAGAAQDAHESLVMLTIGTGVGGGLVIHDRLVRGAHGIGAELGHIVLQEGGPRCGCGNHGDLESLASGTAIGRMARQAVADGRVPAGSPLLDVPDLTGKAVTVAAHAGDEAAAAILAEAGFWLGVGIGSLVNALDPEIVVLGGGAMQAGDLLLEPARRAAEERVMGREHRPFPPIVRAQLADFAGLVGAALLAMSAQPAPQPTG